MNAPFPQQRHSHIVTNNNSQQQPLNVNSYLLHSYDQLNQLNPLGQTQRSNNASSDHIYAIVATPESRRGGGLTGSELAKRKQINRISLSSANSLITLENCDNGNKTTPNSILEILPPPPHYPPPKQQQLNQLQGESKHL